MNCIENSCLDSDSSLLCVIALCTDKYATTYLGRIPYLLQSNNNATTANIEMCKINEEYDNDDFYTYLGDYFKISKCSLRVLGK